MCISVVLVHEFQLCFIYILQMKMFLNRLTFSIQHSNLTIQFFFVLLIIAGEYREGPCKSKPADDMGGKILLCCYAFNFMAQITSDALRSSSFICYLQ